MNKLANSWVLVKASAGVLQQDKELIVYPLVSGVVSILVIVSFFGPMVFLGSDLEAMAEGEGSVLAYLVVFLFYLVQYTVVFFCNAALVGATMIRLGGGDPTVADGFRIASERFGAILGYAVIAATVGMVLKTVAERAGAVGRIATGFLGMAWSLATYLTVPVLVTRDVDPITAVKESAGLFRKTWGEQVAGNVSMGLIIFVAFVGLTVISVPLLIAAGSAGPWALGPAVGAVALGYLGIVLVGSALQGIYQAALYRWAVTGESVAGFDERLMRNAFRTK